MEITYNDFSDENVQLRAHPNFFVNSECLFIEYSDVIRLPHYVLLSFVRESEEMKQYFTFDKLRLLSNEELLEVYIKRKYRNIYQSFYKGNPNTMNLEEADKLIEEQISSDNVFYDVLLRLSIPKAISIILSSKTTKKICIYHPYENEFIKKDISETFGNKNIECVFGEFREVLKIIPEDTTYIFSDIYKVNTLLEENRIDCTTVLVAGEYGYNFLENGDEIIHTEKLKEEHPVHFSYFSIFE